MAEARAVIGRPVPEVVEVETTEWEHRSTKIGDYKQSLPPIYSTIQAGGETYYYFDRRYYREAIDEDETVYEVVPTPIGAIVTRLPYGCKPVEIDHYEYWVCQEDDNDVYYFETTAGYEVVESPE